MATMLLVTTKKTVGCEPLGTFQAGCRRVWLDCIKEVTDGGNFKERTEMSFVDRDCSESFQVSSISTHILVGSNYECSPIQV